MDLGPTPEQRRSWRLLLGGIGLAVVLVGVALVWLLRPTGAVRSAPSYDTAAGSEDASTSAWDKWNGATGGNTQARVVELAFFDLAEGSWGSETQSVNLPDDESQRLRAVVDIWVANAGRSAYGAIVPRRTEFRHAFVTKDRRAYLDFSKEFAAPAGITGELERIVGLVRTLRANFPGLRQVQILIDGQPAGALSGQLDISVPLDIATFSDILE